MAVVATHITLDTGLVDRVGFRIFLSLMEFLYFTSLMSVLCPICVLPLSLPPPCVRPLPPTPMFQFGGNNYMERAREIDQWFRVVIDFTKYLNSVSSTCVDMFITTYNSSSMGFNALLWHLQALYSHTQIYALH